MWLVIINVQGVLTDNIFKNKILFQISLFPILFVNQITSIEKAACSTDN